MPTYSVVAAIVFALVLSGLKLFAVPAHLPPTVAPADIVAVNKAHAVAMRSSAGPAQTWVTASVQLQSDGPRTIVGARVLAVR